MFAPAKRKQPAGLTKRDYIINENFSNAEKLERFFRKHAKFHVGKNFRDSDGDTKFNSYRNKVTSMNLFFKM